MTDQVKVINGSDMIEVKKGHPSLDQGILDEIEDLEVFDLDGEKLPKKEKQKEVAEEETEDEEIQETDEEETTEEVEEEEESEEESEEEEKEETTSEEATEEYMEELHDVVDELRRTHQQVASLKESVGEKPQEPKSSEEDDPQAWTQYRIELASWHTHRNSIESQVKYLAKQVEFFSGKQEDLFVANHGAENLIGFRNWIKDSLEIQTLFFTGKKNLESLYKMYKVDAGEQETKRQVSELKKKGAKFKAINSKGGGKEITSTKYPKEYKFLNNPQYKDLASQLLNNVNPFTGRKPSMKEVDALIKSEARFHKNRGKY